ncbi:arabinosylfuranosidase ArfA [Microbacterium arborescens]|uniref:arabinosylfuranosidase ArfA n=1 Tax=Microbacterium arborescens TaxID=33883 RepID=UPI00278BACAA|nr:alpha-N-arabinofuranosidase [Microbacterium arborescens]MDQ1218264.1 alpha-N-arabinofuranosidase [Microbacterium arborescens]
MLHARLIVDHTATRIPLDRRIFGSFVEHLGRAVYDGIYEPAHPTADGAGFRRDVIDLVTELGVTTIRYPGGNFVSGFRWEDSVGPREQRPTRLDLAWHSRETNEVGLHEFADWLERVDSDLMLAVNLGTRGTLEALDLLEYANLESGTALAELRASNGRERPFGARMWCLGNEMDGPWQIGHRSADDYGKLAAQTARAMRMVDPELELVVCGSSSRSMPTFGEWERVVLGHTYDDVDFISCHAYYEERDGDLTSFLASAVDMDAFIDQVVATIDHVKAVKRSDHVVNISFDEWNVWYNDRFENVDKITGAQNWPVAPRLLEDVYTVADAVVVGNLLISMLRHADRVRSASLAQLVNVIAPIMTEPGGPAWRQTTFFPFALTSRFARGSVVPSRVEGPQHATRAYGDVLTVDAVTTLDEATGRLSVFAVNRSQTDSVELTVTMPPRGTRSPFTHVVSWTLNDSDPHAANTLDAPERIRPKENTSASLRGEEIVVTLPPVSWTVVVADH